MALSHRSNYHPDYPAIHERPRTRRFNVIKRVGDYGTAYAADFTTPVPPAVHLTGTQTKATGLFDALSHPVTGLIARIAANAIIHYVHRSNAARLGAWRAASHVERQPKTTKIVPATPMEPLTK